MPEKIDETLKKIAAGMPSGEPEKNDSQREARASRELLGDPDCPICSGIGYVRLDLPLDHPEFGRVQICSCRSQQVSQAIRQRLFALSNLAELQHLTFENFQPRGRIGLGGPQADSLERAFNHARQFAQSLNGWLLLQGTFGSGKTHLAAAIANFAVGVGVPTLFLTVPDLLDTLRFSFDDPEATFEDSFEQIRHAPVLILDDFGTQNATPWAQEKLFQILNYRYINRLPLVITTNLDLNQIEGRIRSRLQDPDLVTRTMILAPDYRNPTDEGGNSDLSSLDLLHKLTFASFDLRKSERLPIEHLKSLEKAFQTARAFAERPQGWIVFTGPYGCGKTHLAAAIANYRRDLGLDQLFVNVPEMLDQLRATFNPNSLVSYDRRFEQVRSAPLLILDDLGTQSQTPWVREKIYQLFNHRYNAELPTVITTADEREDIDLRLVSRMEDERLCTIYHITAPAYRGIPSRKSKPEARGRAR